MNLQGKWPPQSLDLRIIGSIEKERLGEKAKECSRSLGNLLARVEKVTTKLGTDLYSSISHQIAAVIAAKGQHTKYL